MDVCTVDFIYIPFIITLRFFFRFRSRKLDSGSLQSHRVHGVCIRSTNGDTADGFPLDGDDSVRGSSNIFYILYILYLTNRASIAKIISALAEITWHS